MLFWMALGSVPVRLVPSAECRVWVRFVSSAERGSGLAGWLVGRLVGLSVGRSFGGVPIGGENERTRRTNERRRQCGTTVDLATFLLLFDIFY